jgi:protein-tyrosine phosphatase
MIDLHCHLLPAVDDGSRSAEQSLAVLREMARHGVTAVCLTPHLQATQLNRRFPNTYHRVYQELRTELPPTPEVYLGLEVMLDGPLNTEVGATRRGTLGGSRYMLVELPRIVSRAAVQKALADVLAIGLVPVLAHPERYTCCSVETVRSWREMGARMQVDATTLISARPRGNRARQLLSHGLGDIIAADNHGDGRLISTGYNLLVERGGTVQAELLVTQNPRRILDDAELLPVPPLELHHSLWQRIRRSLSHEEER